MKNNKGMVECLNEYTFRKKERKKNLHQKSTFHRRKYITFNQKAKKYTFLKKINCFKNV